MHYSCYIGILNPVVSEEMRLEICIKEDTSQNKIKSTVLKTTIRPVTTEEISVEPIIKNLEGWRRMQLSIWNGCLFLILTTEFSGDIKEYLWYTLLRCSYMIQMKINNACCSTKSAQEIQPQLSSLRTLAELWRRRCLTRHEHLPFYRLKFEIKSKWYNKIFF